MNVWIRQIHRWLSIAFTLIVVANIVCIVRKGDVVWLAYLALLPLTFLLFTGLYLFVLPYVAKWRGARRTK